MFTKSSFNTIAFLLFLASGFIALSAITYTNKIVSIQVLKQHEKLLKDPNDSKISDLSGLADICQDVRFNKTLIFHMDAQQSQQIDNACNNIKNRLAHALQKDLDRSYQ